MGAKLTEYDIIQHGCDKNGEAIQRSGIDEESFRVAIKALVDQQAAIQLRSGVVVA